MVIILSKDFWKMYEELLDIVDDNDCVVDSLLRSEVHRLGLKHRAVHILVFNSRGEVFLQKRSMKKDKCPGLWDSSASGHLDTGEDYDDCAVRELQEELGISTVGGLTRLFKLQACNETDNEFVCVYKGLYEGDFTLNKDEISEGRWFSIDEIDELIKSVPLWFSGCFIFVWENYRKNT